jgi:hypothetical protein
MDSMTDTNGKITIFFSYKLKKSRLLNIAQYTILLDIYASICIVKTSIWVIIDLYKIIKFIDKVNNELKGQCRLQNKLD